MRRQNLQEPQTEVQRCTFVDLIEGDVAKRLAQLRQCCRAPVQQAPQDSLCAEQASAEESDCRCSGRSLDRQRAPRRGRQMLLAPGDVQAEPLQGAHYPHSPRLRTSQAHTLNCAGCSLWLLALEMSRHVMHRKCTASVVVRNCTAASRQLRGMSTQGFVFKLQCTIPPVSATYR